MSHPIQVGVALPQRDERDAIAGWLAAADMDVEVLVEACKVDSDVSGRGFGCIVADAALLRSGYLASLRRQDPRVPIVAVADPAEADLPMFRRGVSVVVRPLDATTLTLAVSLAHGEGRQARRRPRTRAPRVPSRVSGVPATIVDISSDGVRLELSRAFAAKLGPQFRLQVPMVALDVVLQRAWVATTRADLVQCGARLVAPDASQRLAWERLMEVSGTTMSLPGMHRHDQAVEAPQDARLLARVSRLLSSASTLGSWANTRTRDR
ncbi:MAG: hypothetical protein KA371_03535 [Acidobacteria bacterium]|nr:hypothetical protein [Acidobacteriota bacterium]